MKEYSEFSHIYDEFMDDIPYEEWHGRLHEILIEQGIQDGIVTELGCGTGTMTEMLAEDGYDMIGIDMSMDMLQEAMEKREQSGHQSILYLNQDMREFELYGTVRGIVSICDAMNYLLEEEDLEQVFRLVNNYLDPDGVFVFDFTTRQKFAGIENQTLVEHREEASLIWENTFYEEEEINEYALTIFEMCEDGRFEKYQEIHEQRIYSLECMRELLERCGFQLLEQNDGYTKQPANEQSERIVITAKKKN